MADTHREIETKFDVAPDFALGDPAEFARPGACVTSRTVNLDSTYYDTAEQGLLRSGLTLRRRTGEADTGWHLKVPGAGFRTELHWPLAGNDQPPDELRSLIWPFAGAADLLPTVTLRTTQDRAPGHRPGRPAGVRTGRRRGAGRLRGRAGGDVALAGTRGGTRPGRRHRRPRPGHRPAARARRLRVPGRARSCAGRSASPDDPDTGSAAAVLTRYLRAQCDAVTAGHFAISDKPFEASSTSQPHEAIHQTRVATRRLRAALRIFAPLFDAGTATRLQDELAWFAGELGEVRDREVLRNRLARAVDDLPAYLVVGPVGEQIDEVLLAELRQHADALLATMRDERYRALVPTWPAGASSRPSPRRPPDRPTCWPTTSPPPSASSPSG